MKQIAKIRCQKFVVSLLIGCQIFYFVSPLVSLAQTTADPSIDIGDGVSSYAAPSDPNGTFTPTPADEGLNEPVSTLPFATGPDTKKTSNSNPSAVAAEKFPSDRVVLNALDKHKLQQTQILYSALPDFYNGSNLNELASISNVGYDQLTDYKLNNVTRFNEIVASATTQIKNDSYLLKRVSNDPVTLAALFDQPQSYMAEEILKHPQDVQKAVQQVMDTQVDVRVIKTIKYLITPKDQGGAGHWKIKIERITQNHDKEFNKYENEDTVIKNAQKQTNNSSLQDTTVEQIKANKNETATDTTTQLDASSQAIADVLNSSGKTVATAYIGNGIDEDSNTISAHYSGQAVDISAVDDIKCTTVGHTYIGPDQEDPQSPQAIKLAWQTTEGYNADSASIDTSFNNMFMNASQSSIVNMLSQLNFNFDSVGDLSGASFSDMTSLVAKAFLLNSLGAATDADVWKFNLGDTLHSLGGVMIADKLGLSRGAFLDSNINSTDALSEGVGRSSVETKLGLPYGSLKGQTRDDLLATVGKQRILSELKLPADILDYAIKDDNDLYQRMGSRIIESKFGLNNGSFYGKSTLDDVNKSAGKYKLAAMSSLSSGVDQQLNLPSGTYNNFLASSISPSDLNRLVAEAHLTTFVANYKNYNHSSTSDYIPTITLPSGQSLSNLRDDMFSLPKGQVDRFLNGDTTKDDLITTGKYAIANTLENNDFNRARLTAWLNAPNEAMTVTTSTTDSSGVTITDTKAISYLNYAATMGVTDKDVYRIFGQDNAQAVFKRIGEQLLTQGLKQTSNYQSASQDLMTSVGQVETTSQSLDFYKTRAKNINGMSSSYQNHVRDLNNILSTTSTDKISDQTKQDLNAWLAKLSAAITSIGSADTAAKITAMGTQIFNDTNQLYTLLTNIEQSIGGDTSSSITNLTHAINAIEYDVETIAKNASEINTGQIQTDFRIGDLTVGAMQSLNLSFGNGSFSNADFAALFAGKISLREFLVSAGSAQLAGAYNLPKWALKYAASVVDNFTNDGDSDIKDAFFRAIGISTLEAESSFDSGSLAANSSLGQKISINNFRKIVMDKRKSTQSQADAIIAESLNLKGYNLESLMRGDFAAWSTARAKAEEFDAKNGLDQGTTEKFIKGSALGDISNSIISEDEIRQTATSMHISEASIETFVAAMNGDTNPAINKIYYVDNNKYFAASAASSSDTCRVPEIPDGSYVYYDQDGLHTFNSDALANEYRKAHADRELNYLDEIANSFAYAIDRSALTENTAHDTAVTLKSELSGKIRSSLENFINSNQTKPFDDNTFARLSFLMQTNFNLPSTVFAKAFSRSNESGTIDQSAQMDFLKVLGYNVVKSSAMSQLNDYLGISFGSSKVTPDDLFNIMSGNGQEVFARIGGTMLEQELDLSTGTVQSIFNSDTDDQRLCTLQNAALNLIGNKLGSRGMKLAGSLLNAFGGHRVEDYLSLPHDSFEGKDINELLSSVSVENLAEVFSIPYSSDLVDAANYELRRMGGDYLANNINKGFYDKLKIIQAYIYGLGTDAPTVNAELVDGFAGIRRELTNIFTTVLSDSNIYSADPAIALATLKSKSNFANTSDNNAKIALSAFISEVNAADGAFNLTVGTTAQLLSGKLSANDYRNKVNNTILVDGAGNYIISALGLDGTGITMERFNQFFAAIRHMGNNDINTSTSVTDKSSDRVTVYNFLSDLFSINLDAKAGFSEGTFAQIVAKPWQATTILLNEGIRRIDISLGIADKPDNLQKILNLYMNTSPTDQTACDSQSAKSYSSCINNLRREEILDTVKQGASAKAAGYISDWVSKITNVKVSVDTPMGTKDVKKYGISMPIDDLLGIFHGDYRIILLVGSVKGLAAIIGDNDGRLAVDPRFVLDYQDYLYAIYGDPGLEDYARSRAIDSTFAAQNGASTSSDDTNGTLVNVTLAPNGQTNAINTSSPASVTDATKADIDSAYPVPAGANTAAPVYPGDPPALPDTTGKSPNEITSLYTNFYTQMQDWSNRSSQYASTIQTAAVAAGQAAGQVQSAFTTNLEYKTLDCVLYKLDKDIPAGFTKAMLSGDNKDMVGGIATYLLNKLMNNSSIGQDIPPVMRSALISYLQGNISSQDLVNTVAGAGIDFLDNWLVNNSPSIFGMNIFQPGMFKGIVALVQSGNFNTEAVLSGIVFPALNKVMGTKTLASQISKWVDDKLGMPSGITFAIYTYYTNKKATWLDLAAMLLPEKFAGYLEKAQKFYDLFKQAKGGISTSGGAADAINRAINIVGLDKVIGWADEKLGLPPGTLQHIIIGIVTSNPEEILKGVITLLFGVHSIDVVCTANGNYPSMESTPDATKWDVANLGNFDGMSTTARQQGYMRAAQYKAGQLVFDMLAARDRTGDADLVPTQIMTGRVEDVGPNATLVQDTICDRAGSSSLQDNTAICSGWRSRAGVWANPQTTAWTHIGF